MHGRLARQTKNLRLLTTRLTEAAILEDLVFVDLIHDQAYSSRCGRVHSNLFVKPRAKDVKPVDHAWATLIPAHFHQKVGVLEVAKVASWQLWGLSHSLVVPA